MKKTHFFSFGGTRDWREWLVAFALALVFFVLLYGGLSLSDRSRTKEMDALAASTLEVAREAGDVEVTVGPDETLQSMKYILLQRPVNTRRFEGRGRWIRADEEQTLAEKIEETEFHWLHHKVLFEREQDARVAPGSLTKLMTILVALEQYPNLDAEVELTAEMFALFYDQNAAIAGLSPGDVVTVRDLLAGAMLTPGAECASALAIYTAGSEQAFVQRMNEKAAQIGMTSTHYTNVTGIESEQDYTTVSDLALLLDYALSNADFKEIFTLWQYTTSPVYGYADGMTLTSTLYGKEGFTPVMSGGAILGAKTGTTEQSGQCVAALFEKDGVEFIFVSAEGQPGYSPTHTTQVDDLEKAFGLVTVS
ncbi:MAG: hypothetical protein LBR14_04405 [Clostridiales Family XIII bacterium]|jgi:D-alanyl-D-alanine carboxypeptidase (penicillin-binding protein 5/6)|nr:hypothetical protein [Clostridiales Family XIII bacterium]